MNEVELTAWWQSAFNVARRIAPELAEDIAQSVTLKALESNPKNVGWFVRAARNEAINARLYKNPSPTASYLLRPTPVYQAVEARSSLRAMGRSLSARDKEIVQLLADNHSVNSISKRLNISRQTIWRVRNQLRIEQ